MIGRLIPTKGAAAESLERLFRERLLIADGSTGTALEALAPEAAASGRVSLLPLERPDIVEALHAAYFDAGSDIVETASFSSSLRDLRLLSVDFEGGAERLCYEVNKAAAMAASRAAARARAARKDSGGIALVAGSMGPGDSPPSLGTASYDELFRSYLPQARGLAEGGCDFAIIETCQDPLQIKAAISALRSVDGGACSGSSLPFVVSITVDEHGKMLTGTDIEALIAIIAPFNPLAIGLNCSGGPDELAFSLEILARHSPFPLCFMPNAGLPCSIDGCTTYPFGPETFARKVETLARSYGISIVGGCCGSGPGHIEALAQRLMDRPIPRQRPKPRPALASLYRAKPISTGFFKVGERANSAGSAAFAALLDAEDFEGMADKALLQEKTGAAAIDIHLSRAGRDEASDLERLVRLLSSRSNAALSLDSSDPAVLARALPYVGGRPLLNSTSLEDIDKARRVFELAFEFGAAVVCLALDGAGPAASVQDKVGICRKLYDMATREYGLSPDSLLFDPLTFTIAAGGDPATTIQAIGAVKTACPGSLSVLGVGNISYGLPRQVRSAVTAIFLEKAMQAGLDAAILDTGGVPDLGTIDPDLKRAALQALRFEKTDQAPEDAADALEGLLEWAAAHSKSPPVPAPPTRQHTDEGGPGSVGTALAAALARGDARSAEKEALLFLETEEPATLMALVTESMAESGRLWNEGILSLPLVLRSAEAAKRALAPLADSDKKEAKGTIIMATVKGDLHDIGKNIVAAILACSGWNIVDLGTDVPTSQIVEAARQKSVVAVGLSGLLTRSLAEMKKTCTALNQEGIACLVLCGGAAVDPRYVERELEPQHPGLVKTCKDAFEAARVLAELVLKENKSEAKGKTPAHPAPPFLSEQAAPKGSAISPPSKQAYRPLLTGAQAPRSLEFSRLVKALNERWLFSTLWAYRGEELASSKGELRRLLAEVEPILCPAMVYGHFPCRRLSPDLLLIGEPNKSTELLFPRETGGHRRSLSDYFCAEGDMMPIFAVTIGRELSDQAIRLKEEGRYEEYWKLHGLGSALAEAAARLAHERIEDEIRAGGGPGKARRYSFGFPACPGTEYQRVILDLLGAERINLDVTAGHQLVPEHSITAFLVPREDAVYFDA